MVALQIRDIPDDVRNVLATRARERGQSLNLYLRELVLREAAFENNRVLIDEVVARRGRSDITAEDVFGAVDAARGGR
ncbi:FitA-like ribbon-helix-helix domain-containing protein [Phycicoccus flavus]|uniref:FitA-like ribbon-helix-helix domain-containing protein n=1 Tax=Phycicoccus flavus TaxID=2502783 RepID=UPI000FEBE110|nr:hypothetical protein [Phycicoccus flavus]NHA70112.1 hypothetical protein [Phycicoccus flavus]